jgi:hypothetical protein
VREAKILVCTIPVLVRDLRRVRFVGKEKLELLSLMERLLGPSAIGPGEGETTPYRHRLRSAE